MAKNNSVNNTIKYTATLGIFCLAASGFLSIAYRFTRPRILYQQTAEEQLALKDVFPQADDFEPVREKEATLYYRALSPNKKVLGYAFKAVRRGYSSDIVVMAGLKSDGILNNIKIIFQNETPGLGARIVEVVQKKTLWNSLLKKIKIDALPQPWFQARFRGKRLENLDFKKAEECGKKMKQKIADASCDESVVAITGATISSKAVMEAVRLKGADILKKEKHE